jgi:transcriptional regulator with XRE-family HTH domain
MQIHSRKLLRRLAHHGTIGHMTTQPHQRVPEFHAGDRLRKARELTGLDQEHFAESIGISRGSVSNYERSSRPPKPIVLKGWALATGVPVEWLEHGTGASTPPPDGDGEPEEPDREAALARLAEKKRRHAAGGDNHRYAA